jgi:hypothetical protein
MMEQVLHTDFRGCLSYRTTYFKSTPEISQKNKPNEEEKSRKVKPIKGRK